MNSVFWLKVLLSVFLLSGLVRYATRYLALVFQSASEDQLRSYFIRAWKDSFLMLLNGFGFLLIWFPTALQSDFFANPAPTLIVVIVASLILATMLATSAKDPSESRIFWQKVLDGIKHEDMKDKE